MTRRWVYETELSGGLRKVECCEVLTLGRASPLQSGPSYRTARRFATREKQTVDDERRDSSAIARLLRALSPRREASSNPGPPRGRRLEAGRELRRA